MGTLVTRSDAEPTQNAVCFSPKVPLGLYCGQINSKGELNLIAE